MREPVSGIISARGRWSTCPESYCQQAREQKRVRGALTFKYSPRLTDKVSVSWCFCCESFIDSLVENGYCFLLFSSAFFFSLLGKLL